MEPAKIDWKNLEWVFIEDELYEHINAPKWFDFSAPQEDHPADDVAWFCRPDCNHPTTADGFLKSTPKSNKKSANAYKTLLLGEMDQRSEDSETQNPNHSTPVNHHIRSSKPAFKLSSEKKKPVDELPQANETPRLKSIPSARNLLAGRTILNQINEFVGELKKLASRAKEREENMEKLNVERTKAHVKEGTAELLHGMGGEAKERKPLLELRKGKSDGSEMSISEEKHRLNRIGDDENIPIPLGMEKVRPKGKNALSQIRTSPPTPQCFSATRGTTRKTPAKETRARLMERQILQEVKQNPEEIADKGPSSSFNEREMKMLDLFWMLKPCTPSS